MCASSRPCFSSSRSSRSSMSSWSLVRHSMPVRPDVPTTSAPSAKCDVVVPVRNRLELTERCLEHLRAQSAPHDVIVVDNGSSDSTCETLRRRYPEVRVVELGANRGFPAACNHGAATGTHDVVVL